MGIFLQEKKLRVVEVIGENRVETMVEGTLDLPLGKPEIDRVLYARLQPEITNLEVVENKVVVQGTMGATVVYVPVPEEEKDLPAVSVSYREAIPFTTEISLEGAIPGVEVRPKLRVQKVTVDAAGKRRFEVDAVVAVTVRALKTLNYSVVSGATVSEGHRVQVRRETMNLLDLVGFTMCQIPLKTQLQLGEELPLMAEVVDLWALPSLVGLRVVDGKVLVEGDVDFNLIYLSQGEEETAYTSVSSARFEKGVHFAGEAPLAEAVSGMQGRGMVLLKKVDTRLVNPFTLEVNLLLEVWAEVYRQTEMEAVTEIATEGVEEIAVNRQLIQAEAQVGEKTVEFSAEGHLQIPSHRPPVRRVIAADAVFQPVETRVLDGKVMVDGVLGVRILYQAAAEEEKPVLLHVVEFPEALRVTEFMDFPRVQSGMTVDHDVLVKKVGVELIDADTLQVEISGEMMVRVTSRASLEVITEAVVVPPALGDEATSFRIVVVQPGDTLWKLAHYYRTTVEAITAANGLAPGTPLQVGQKLRIRP